MVVHSRILKFYHILKYCSFLHKFGDFGYSSSLILLHLNVGYGTSSLPSQGIGDCWFRCIYTVAALTSSCSSILLFPQCLLFHSMGFFSVYNKSNTFLSQSLYNYSSFCLEQSSPHSSANSYSSFS